MMLTPSEAERNTAIVDLLCARLPDVEAVYLFGSQATGQSRPESDIDVAVLTCSGAGWVDRVPH